jgi:hypothetical protein
VPIAKKAARFREPGPIPVATDQKPRFNELPGLTARVLS